MSNGKISRILLISSFAFLSLILVLYASQTPEDVLHFDHGLHISEVGVSCDDCHSDIQDQEPGKRSLPDHDICSMCHDVEDSESCGTCHSDPENPVEVPAIVGKYEGFAHPVHSDLECVQCHGQIATSGDSPEIPGMDNCQSCHLVQDQSLDCATCHQGQRPVPDYHLQLTWMDDHGLEAAFDPASCARCHEQESCDQCHQGENILAKTPHPPTWMFTHFADAAYGGECLTCHETRTSCVQCHRSSIPAPHTFGLEYANSNGGRHVEDAENFFETCLTCHDVEEGDPTCARCHD